MELARYFDPALGDVLIHGRPRRLEKSKAPVYTLAPVI